MRGQVTGFAIIGVLILIVVGTLMYLSRPPPVGGPDGTRPSLTVEQCIENAAIEQIRLVGLAGGVDPDDGSLREPIGDAHSALGLSDIEARVALYAWIPSNAGPPHRPSATHYFETGDRTAINTFPFFENPPLGQRSTSEVLTTRIEDELSITCDADLETVTYSDTTIVIHATVREEGRGARDFTVSIPVPLRDYHRILRGLIEQENRDPQFRIATYAPSGFTLRTLPVNADGDSLIVLTSDRPLLGSEPFRYLTIIKDRPPVFILDPTGADAKLVCDSTTTTKVQDFGGTQYPASWATTQGVLVDPDDLHTPSLEASCTEVFPDAIFTITSTGATPPHSYSIEVPV